MASVTLAESAKLAQDTLVTGLIEAIITVNHMYELLPFAGIDGNALAYNRENVLGDVQSLGVAGTITAKAAATFTKVTSNLTKIIGDAEVDGLIQATRSADNDQTGIQIASKAKSAGRNFQTQLINGTGASDQFNGLINLCASGQKGTTGASGSNLSFTLLDEMLDLVTAKDGEVDYICMHARTIRSYKVLLRALGGVTMQEVYELPSGKNVPAYSGTPILRNDYIPVNQTKGGSGAVCTTVFAGVFDDGGMKTGLMGLTAANAYGLMVEDVGISETKDERIWRVKWYCGLALFSELGLACLDGILN
jgi:hypothetical protein